MSMCTSCVRHYGTEHAERRRTAGSGRTSTVSSEVRMSGLRTILVSTAVVGALGVGYGMWSIISPSEERRREIVKNLPESNPVRLEETRQRNAMVMQVLKEAAETNDNVARGYGGPFK